ncbi:MAG TPA: hypothetical protein VNT51_08150, partial [Miltoncostaeaceae bacterium]|nr:hypothetical protein [Miltoncostaeaceae bacterium]
GRGDARSHADLAATLHALDHPEAATGAARGAAELPWGRWWGLLAAGQAASHADLGDRLEEAFRVPTRGPDAREVRRRIADLRDELAALAGDADADARFALLGMADGPPRRVLLVGRSSAAFVVAPAWEGMRLVRLGPSEGPAGGNRAHHTLAEIVQQVRRGERGGNRPVPPDDPPPLDAAELLEGLREGRGARDRRLLELADEVREERARLREARAKLEDDRAVLRHALDQVRTLREEGVAASAGVPTTREEAAALLAVAPSAGPEEVERAWRREVVRCHPDRVAELHPGIREQAEGLTVALNAARDLLLGLGVRRRR